MKRQNAFQLGSNLTNTSIIEQMMYKAPTERKTYFPNLCNNVTFITITFQNKLNPK